MNERVARPAGNRNDQVQRTAPRLNGSASARPPTTTEAEPVSDLNAMSSRSLLGLQISSGNQAVLQMLGRAPTDGTTPVPMSRVAPDAPAHPRLARTKTIRMQYGRRDLSVQRGEHDASTATPSADFMGEGWDPVARMGLVYKDDGVFLRDKPLPGDQSQHLAQLPQNTRVIVVRANPTTQWYAVRVQGGQYDGKFGYAVQSHVRDDLPDINAVMHRVTSGETLGGLVQSHPQYASYGITTGDDARSIATAVYIANKDRGVRLNLERFEAKNDWFEDALDLTDEYRSEMRRIYQSVELVAGELIWLPGQQYITALKSANIIPTRADWKNTAIEVGKSIGGFTAGLVQGFLQSIADALEGLYDIGKSIIDVIIDVVTGEALTKAQELYDYFTNLTVEEIKELAQAIVSNLVSGTVKSVQELIDRWNVTHVYNRWNFRGIVTGNVLSEVVMLLISGGAANALKWLGKLGNLGSRLANIVGKVATKIDSIVPGSKRRDRDDADADIGERAIALAKARTIAEAHDAADLPVSTVLAALGPLKRYKGVDGFSARPLAPGHYRIIMRTVVDDDYTPSADSGRGVPGKGSERYRKLLASVKDVRNTRSYATGGNYSVRLKGSLGVVNRAEADFIGTRFVGDGYHINEQGMMIGRRFNDGDKLCRRVYRPAQAKPGNPRSATGVQANYVTEVEVVDVKYHNGERLEKKRWQAISNGHIDISDGVSS